MFFIFDSASYFGNDRYMALIPELTNCSSFMFSTKLFEFLIKLFPDVVNCCNSFDKSLHIFPTADFCVFITSLSFNGFSCIFNNGHAEGVFGV